MKSIIILEMIIWGSLAFIMFLISVKLYIKWYRKNKGV
jgi:hypothetical protein